MDFMFEMMKTTVYLKNWVTRTDEVVFRYE